MTVNQIALSAAHIVQADDIAELLEAAQPDYTDADVKTLIKCVNLAAAELCLQFPVLLDVTVTATDGLISYSQFARPPIVHVVKKRGKLVHFDTDSRGIAVSGDGEYAVTYSLPWQDVGGNDALNLAACVDEQLISYLTARNYCLITGRTDEASIWDQMYSSAAEDLRLKRKAKIPARPFYG